MSCPRTIRHAELEKRGSNHWLLVSWQPSLQYLLSHSRKCIHGLKNRFYFNAGIRQLATIQKALKGVICLMQTSFHLETSDLYFMVASLLTSCDIPQRKAFERLLGLRDHQNSYFSAFSVSPLMNSWHFLTMISEFAAMIRAPSGIASDADRLQLANKALWFFSAPLSQPIYSPGCRNRDLNLLLIVAVQRLAHATSMQAGNQ